MTGRAQRRFRFILPLLLLVLSIFLTIWGDAYRQGIIDGVVNKYGYLEEPMPQNVAFGRFLAYALNAPAYVASMSMPFIFHVRRWHFIHGEKDWWYFTFILVSWYAVGRTIDRLMGGLAPSLRGFQRRIVLLCIGFIVFGLFISFEAIKLYQPPCNYARWFEIAVFSWGALIIVWSSYSLSHASKGART